MATPEEAVAEELPALGTHAPRDKENHPASLKSESKHTAETHWWPYMDHAGKVAVTAFFFKQKGVPVSGANDRSRTSNAISLSSPKK
jgi:hypothetical protein